MERQNGQRQEVFRGWRSPFVYPTSLFIRDYLLEKGEAYPYEIYQALREKRQELGIYVGSPLNFYKYIYILRSLGLIEETGREEESFKASRFWRKYYRIVPGKEKLTDEWRNPQKTMSRLKGWKVGGRK